jgi:hypothetical protein
MLDVIMLAMGIAFFVLSVGYVVACDRLRGDRHDHRLFARRPRDRRADVLSRLRFAAAGAVLSEGLSSSASFSSPTWFSPRCTSV